MMDNMQVEIRKLAADLSANIFIYDFYQIKLKTNL